MNPIPTPIQQTPTLPDIRQWATPRAFYPSHVTPREPALNWGGGKASSVILNRHGRPFEFD